MTCRAFFICASLLLSSTVAASAACTASEAETLRVMADAGSATGPAARPSAHRGRSSGPAPGTRPAPTTRWLANAPAGSCLKRDGSWCWPVSPTSYGQPCTCPDGSRGVGQ